MRLPCAFVARDRAGGRARQRYAGMSGLGGKPPLASWVVILMRKVIEAPQVRDTRLQDCTATPIEMEDLAFTAERTVRIKLAGCILELNPSALLLQKLLGPSSEA